MCARQAMWWRAPAPLRARAPMCARQAMWAPLRARARRRPSPGRLVTDSLEFSVKFQHPQIGHRDAPAFFKKLDFSPRFA